MRWVGAAALIALTSPRAALADAPDAPNSDALATEGDSAPSARRRAVVTLVGASDSSQELEALLRELLERNGVELTLDRRLRFDPHEVLETGELEDDVRVFIELTEPQRARLYFRGPRGERFLVRQVALPDGTSDVGRELLGQVVEAATESLFASGEGLSQEQAREAIEREPPASTPVNAAPAQSQRPAEPPSLVARLGLRYSVEFQGGAVDVRHGPGLDFGVERRAKLVLGAGLVVERGFTQNVHVHELAATQQVSSVRLTLEVGTHITKSQIVALSAGGGVDIARLEPGVARSPDVQPAPASTHVAPVLRVELRYELDWSRLTLGAALLMDLALEQTHFEIDAGHASEPVGSLWSARPGGALCAGYRFGR